MTLTNRIALNVRQKFKASNSSVVTNKDNIGVNVPLDNRQEYRENDNVSHFICRLAYCRTEELRRWFVTQEQRLFEVRLRDADPLLIKQLLEQKCGINYQTVDPNQDDWKQCH